MSADELPSWRESTAKQSIVEFVAAVKLGVASRSEAIERAVELRLL
jgi:hypothetical protein